MVCFWSLSNEVPATVWVELLVVEVVADAEEFADEFGFLLEVVVLVVVVGLVVTGVAGWMVAGVVAGA